jgi:hypothetical protein
MRLLVLVLAACAFSGILRAQQTACPIHSDGIERCVYFRFTPRNTSSPRYTVAMREDGRVAYWQGVEVPDGLQQNLPHLHASATTVKTVFAAAPAVKTGQCETAHRNIASSGSMQLIVSSSEEGYKPCTFHYSDNERVNAAANAMRAIAETMQTGEELTRLHRFDRLGLDPAMQSLVEEAKEGRALEIENIAPVLQSIVDDDRIFARVRREAATLLQDSSAAPAPQKDLPRNRCNFFGGPLPRSPPLNSFV